MIKQHNILGEVKRKKNNKKIKKSKVFNMKDTIENIKGYEFSVNLSKEEKPYLNPYELFYPELFKKEKPPQEEMNFLQAFIILLLAVLFFFFAFQRAVDIHALNTCEVRGDCAEVIRDINGR